MTGPDTQATCRCWPIPAFPLVLAHEKGGKSRNGNGQGGRVISITMPDSGVAKRIENDLAAKRPVEIYDIYFDYNSATVKPESDSVLRTLGDIMRGTRIGNCA